MEALTTSSHPTVLTSSPPVAGLQDGATSPGLKNISIHISLHFVIFLFKLPDCIFPDVKILFQLFCPSWTEELVFFMNLQNIIVLHTNGFLSWIFCCILSYFVFKKHVLWTVRYRKEPVFCTFYTFSIFKYRCCFVLSDTSRLLKKNLLVYEKV